VIHVIGSINLDLIATVSRLPKPGETVAGDRFSSAPGGKGANQALAARRAGAAVTMTGAVGDDAFSASALELLRDGGVDLRRVASATTGTGIALILVGGDGENVIAVVAGANATVGAASLAGLGLAAGDVVLLQQEIPLATVASALAAARRAGALSVLNIAPARPERAELAAEADIVVANETEFDLYSDSMGLAGSDRPARMADFVRRSGRTMIVTLGADGVIAATPSGPVRVPALPVTPVDTVGAGDTFCGYLAAALAEGQPLPAALRLAAAAGSLACLVPGAQPSIPLRPKVEAALKPA